MANAKLDNDGSTMIPKDVADCLIELHKSQLDHFKQTREIEFKVNLALWTLIAVSGSFLSGKVHLSDASSWLIFGITALSVYLGHMFLWMMPIQNSEDTDDYFINKYRNEVEKIVGVSIAKSSTAKKPEFLWKMVTGLRKNGWSWILAETGITLVLLVMVGILLASN